MDTILRNKSPNFVEKGSFMNAIELKEDLFQKINLLDDLRILKALSAFMDQLTAPVEEPQEKWEDMPEEVRDDIEEALAESKRGEGIPHEKVMDTIKEKHPEHANHMATQSIKELFSNL